MNAVGLYRKIQCNIISSIQIFISTLFMTVITGSGAHPTFYPVGTGGPFPRGKDAGA
jgi:hypothetical protein